MQYRRCSDCFRYIFDNLDHYIEVANPSHALTWDLTLHEPGYGLSQNVSSVHIACRHVGTWMKALYMGDQDIVFIRLTHGRPGTWQCDIGTILHTILALTRPWCTEKWDSSMFLVLFLIVKLLVFLVSMFS